MATQLLDVRIDRSSPVPLYHQLAEQLTAAVTDGRLESGDPFENETAMCARLGLSRPTVRRALQEMVDQGLLVRLRGVGTTVANRKVHRRFELSSLYDELKGAGRSPRTTVLAMDIVQEGRAATALDLAEGAETLSIVRLRLVEDKPLALLHNWLPPQYFDLTHEELEATGLYDALRTRGGKPVVARQSIGARMPTAGERRHLGLHGGRPVLTMTRMAFDAAGKAVEFGDHIYVADDYALDMVVDER
jgi:DNA-binding GntR family transcriptional regulator